uniref:Putative secreted protein n=1 Tax=Amblyomma triste TaxID=251400 RepID=A0A023G4P4_AMBTT
MSLLGHCCLGGCLGRTFAFALSAGFLGLDGNRVLGLATLFLDRSRPAIFKRLFQGKLPWLHLALIQLHLWRSQLPSCIICSSQIRHTLQFWWHGPSLTNSILCTTLRLIMYRPVPSRTSSEWCWTPTNTSLILKV